MIDESLTLNILAHPLKEPRRATHVSDRVPANREGSGKTVILLSGHWLESPRRAGFHWLAESLWQQGWTVIFMTTGVSLLSQIKQHPSRIAMLKETPHNQLIWHRERLASFLWYTPWHPVKFRPAVLNQCLSPLFAQYGNLPLHGMKQQFQAADLVIFESTSGLLLFDRIRRLNPRAKLVYRVSDDLRHLGTPPCVLRQERRIAHQFDLISLTSEPLRSIFPPLDTVHFQPQGIPTDRFSQSHPNPYPNNGQIHAVSVGTMLFDQAALEYASRLYPNVSFHIIGAIEPDLERENVHFYGELDFEQMIPYIQWADLGLALYRCEQGEANYLGQSSNKLIQYSYCQLPIVAPTFACWGRDHAFGYDGADLATLDSAIQKALRYDRSQISIDNIPSWHQLASSIVQSVSDASGFSTASMPASYSRDC